MQIGDGSYWKSMQARKNSNRALMNRAVVDGHVANMQQAGNKLFAIGVTKTNGMVELAFEKALKNMQAQAQARLASLEGLGSQIEAIQAEQSTVDRTV